MKARNTFSRMLHQLGHSGSGFGSYYGSVHMSNCTGCPDCRCDEGGPSFEEARRDFRAMAKSKIGGSWYSP